MATKRTNQKIKKGVEIENVLDFTFFDVKPGKKNKNKNKNKLLAFCTVTVDNWLNVKGYKVIENEDGEIVAYNPSAKGQDGNYYVTAYCETEEYRDILSDYIVDAYIQHCEEH